MLEFSTAGISISWAVEATAGTKPSTGFAVIPCIKGIPDTLNPEPETIQVTDLSDLEWHRYIPALKSMGGNLALEANFTSSFVSTWEAMVASAASAFSAGKATWFAVNVPKLNKAFMFSGMPAELGFPGAEVDDVFAGSVYITPNSMDGWGAIPSLAS